jgi:hypothetical protein
MQAAGSNTNGGSNLLLLSSGMQFWLFRFEFQLCSAQNIPFEYVLTSGQFIYAILRTVFVQVKARKVKRLFKTQKVVAHGVTFQRRTAIKLLPTASHFNAVPSSSCCSKLQNKKYNRNGALRPRNVKKSVHFKKATFPCA